jgi:hypothetical protein
MAAEAAAAAEAGGGVRRLASRPSVPLAEGDAGGDAGDSPAGATAGAAGAEGAAAPAAAAAAPGAEGGEVDSGAWLEAGFGPGVPRPLVSFVKRHTAEEARAYAAAVERGVPMARLAPLAFAALGGESGGESGGGAAPDAAAGAADSATAATAGGDAAAVPEAAAAAAAAAPSEAVATLSEAPLPPELEALVSSGDPGAPAWAADAAALSALAAGGAEDAERPLPPVAPPAVDPLETYVLQFDGASRNNPGRASWAYVLLRGAEARSRVGHGCMTLLYGTRWAGGAAGAAGAGWGERWQGEGGGWGAAATSTPRAFKSLL